MTTFTKAVLLDAPVLAVSVALELDPVQVLAWVSAGFFGALAWLIQREWSRHEKSHATSDKRDAWRDRRLERVERHLNLEPIDPPEE